MSCLEFPGAIFVGIHDDKKQTGLAAVVRRNMPEDSTIVDLDSGSIDCSGDRSVLVLHIDSDFWISLTFGLKSTGISYCRAPGKSSPQALVDRWFPR